MEAEIAATKVSVHSGLARARGRFALRVHTASADQAIRELKIPSDQAPVLPVSKMFKIQPVPVGAQPKDIVAWAAALKWPVKVIKMLGRDVALLGANVDPPHAHLLMNEIPIMIRPVQQKTVDSRSAALVARPKSFPPVMPKTQSPDSKSDPWLKNDPWAASPNTAIAKSATAAGAQPAGPAKVRQVDAPTATKFQAIEARLAQFETDLSQVKDGQQLLVKSLESNVATTKTLDGKVSNMQQQLQSSVERAINTAMASQTKSLDSKFEGLMKMMRASQQPAQSAKRDRQQRAADPSDEEMESP